MSTKTKYAYTLTLLIAVVVFLASCQNKNATSAQSENDTVIDLNASHAVDPILAEFNIKIAADSTNAQLYYLRAKYYMRIQKLSLANIDAEMAVALDTLKGEYYLLLADIYLYRNESRKTNDVLTKYLSINPSDKMANFKMAQLMLYVKHYDEGLKFANAVYNTDKKDLNANFLMGMLYKEKGDTAHALDYFRNCIDIKPDYFEAYDQLGYIQKARNKPDAMDYFNSALKIRPQSVTSLYGRAMCYQNNGDFDNAIKDYTTITQIKPDMFDAYFNMGYIHQVNLNLYREAIKYYSQALSADSTNIKARYNIGFCLEQLGDIGNARISYQKCIDQEPTFDKAREALKRVMK